MEQSDDSLIGCGTVFCLQIYRLSYGSLSGTHSPYCRIRSKGIILAARCRCCVNPSVESINYLFIQSDISKEVWQQFGNIFRIPHTYKSVLHPFSVLLAGHSESSQYGMCCIGIAAYIFREVWVARCRTTYDEIPMNVREVCLKVKHRVHLLNLVHMPQKIII